MPVVAVLGLDWEAGRFAVGLRCLCHVLYSSRTPVDVDACVLTHVHAHVCACVLFEGFCVCVHGVRVRMMRK